MVNGTEFDDLVIMATKKHQKPHDILAKAFKNKKSKNPSYSQSALARDLGVSSVFVSKILTGEKDVPSGRFKKLFTILDMDINQQVIYIKATLLNSVSEDLIDLAQMALLKESNFENYKIESSKKLSVLKKWFNVPMLTYLTCDRLDYSPKAIAKYFNVGEAEVLESLNSMKDFDLVENKNGVWKKIENHSYFPTTQSKSDVRDFHKQMIQKAYQELSRTDAQAFEKRLITGFSIATNPENLEKSKKLIFDFLSELSHTLSDGVCTEVYQCNVQLFSHGKSK